MVVAINGQLWRGGLCSAVHWNNWGAGMEIHAGEVEVELKVLTTNAYEKTKAGTCHEREPNG